MQYLRKANERGLTQLDWIKSYHSFSFGDYQDHNHISFAKMRVINDDLIAPNSGFDFHSHHNMEIITYLIEGRVTHRDNLGNEETIKAPQIQVMSAGSGITHAEHNPSKTTPLKLLQIWIKPKLINIEPRYEQKIIGQQSNLTLLVSPDARQNSLAINQDAFIYRLSLKTNEKIELSNTKQAYLHLIQGNLVIGENNEFLMSQGDGAGFSETGEIKLKAKNKIEALYFEFV